MTLVPCVLCHRQPDQPPGWTQTCPTCVSRVRRNLITVEEGYALLAEEMLARVGAATPPDPTGRRTDQHLMLGGDILVMLGPGSTAWHSDDGFDVDSIVGRLERYERDWRITFREPAANTPAIVTRCTLYLLRRLQKAADELDSLLFAEFDQDMRIMRRWIEIALRNGPQRSDIACYCGRHGLERAMPREDGRVIEWRCEYCHREYDSGQFNLLWRESGQAV